jgi:hypothetical protein
VSRSISAENKLPGDTGYNWTGVVSDKLEGFSDPFSVNLGETISFKVNATSSNWTIDIYRVGYYGGAGGRLITTVNKSAPSLQPPPTFDATTALVDAGNWSVTDSYNTAGDTPSGVYLASLKDDAGNQFVIPFVVRDDNNPHDIVFQTSDTTWAAYTGWGGYNFYGVSAKGYAPGPGAHAQAYKVSYNRPFSTAYSWGLYSGPQDSFFGAESAAVFWLEQNGYDVSYQGGVDTEQRGVGNHKVFISCGHDEYWSLKQRRNVEAARDAGINLMFWSGNECYWHTRWEADSQGENYRTLVCYKETWENAKVDPSPEWTGTWRDPRFQPADPENSMTGQIFMVNGPNNDTDSVPPPLNQLPFWAGTAIGDGSQTSLAPGNIGYEWDEVVQNGHEPPVTLLSQTVPPVDVKLLCLDNWGNTFGPGKATHSMTIYQAPSGALVFGAGIVFFAWWLSNNYDLPGSQVAGTDNPPWFKSGTDPSVQQAMMNLFAKMGVVTH